MLNGEMFYSLKKAKILIEEWRHHFNTVRPHRSIDYRRPAPEAILPKPITLTYGATRQTAPRASQPPEL